MNDDQPTTNALATLAQVAAAPEGAVFRFERRHLAELPQEAQDYVNFIEKEIGVRIAYVSNGPKREEIIKR